MKKLLTLLVIFAGAALIAWLVFFRNGNESGERKEIKEVVSNTIKLSIPEEANELVSGMSEVVKNTDKSKMDSVMKFIKDKSDEGSLSSKEGIKDAISEAEEQFGTVVPENVREGIADSLTKLENMGFSTEIIVEKTEGLYEKYGAQFVDHMEEAFVEAAKDAAENTAQNVWDSTKKAVSSAIDGALNR